MSSSSKEIKEILRGLKPAPIGKYRYYSVLLPLIGDDDDLSVLFELRSMELDTQPGEVCFPGGRIEDGESPEEAAVRETCEEIGVSPADIEVYGRTNYIITYRQFTMYGVCGRIRKNALDTARINSREVEEVFLVPLSFFLENEPEVYERTVHADIPEDFPVQRYKWNAGSEVTPLWLYTEPDTKKERVIWGLTARLLYDFVKLLTMDRSSA